ncbi:hypothetical protein V8F06_009658 [Rhypophila decipiens]
MEPLLTPSDAQNLERDGLLLHGPTAGIIRLHKRRLNRSSDEEHQHIPLEVAPNSPLADDAFADLPSVLISRETLIHLGYTDEKAGYIWDCWTNWPDDTLFFREGDPDDEREEYIFLDYLIEHIRGTTEPRDVDGDRDEDWTTYLTECGISADLQSRIMHPRFAYLRRTESCLYWIRDTFQMRYGGLELVQVTSQEREMQLITAASRPGGSGGSGGRRSRRSVTAVSAFQRQRQPSTSDNLDIWGGSAQIGTTINTPHYVTLFKCLDQRRAKGLLTDDGTLRQDAHLLSAAPSDCSNTNRKFYFTPNIKVAEYYASYAKTRIDVHSVVMVVVQIPNSAINTIPPKDVQRLFWPSDDWKEFVWHNRRNEDIIPTRLEKYADTLLFIGHTATKPNRAWAKIESPRHVDESCVLRIGEDGQLNNGSPALQWVFNGNGRGRTWLKQNISSIKSVPYPQAELDAYLAI